MQYGLYSAEQTHAFAAQYCFTGFCRLGVTDENVFLSQWFNNVETKNCLKLL